MSAQERKGWPRQILIVDDEQSVLKTYHNILTSHFPDYRIEVAANGFDAIEAFRQRRHDLMILDLAMPIMDGRRAEYEIRMFCEDREIPEPAIIFCTGYLPPDDVRDLLKINPSCSLLLKPVTTDTLVKEITKRLAPEEPLAD